MLLGPEQASTSSFRKLLQLEHLQGRIGLVAINECHTIRHWQEFRPAFSMLGQLRDLLPKDVLWFACSATLDEETQTAILEHSGFRQYGPKPYQAAVVRTSINRMDMSICIRPIPKGLLSK